MSGVPSKLPEYAVTLTGPLSDSDVFEDVLDLLPEACMVGGVEYGPTADLVFTVDAPSPAGALAAGLAMLDRRGVPVRDGAVLAVRRHEDEPGQSRLRGIKPDAPRPELSG